MREGKLLLYSPQIGDNEEKIIGVRRSEAGASTTHQLCRFLGLKEKRVVNSSTARGAVTL